MEQKRIAYLIKKLNSGDISSEERKELEDFWEWASKDDSLFNAIPEIEKEKIRMAMKTQILFSIKSQQDKRYNFWPQISAYENCGNAAHRSSRILDFL